jgi:hypothetical protein
MYGSYDEEIIDRYRLEDSWQPWSLVDTSEKTGYIVNVNTVKRSCRLSDGLYDIEIQADPCNVNPQGRNGAAMMASANVLKDGKKIAQSSLGTCGGFDNVATALLVQPGGKFVVETSDEYGIDETVRCYISTRRDSPIRLRFSYRNPNKGAYVKYEKGSGPIRVRLSKEERIPRSPGQTPSISIAEWEEVFDSQVGGTYVEKQEGGTLLEFKYIRKDGKEFTFENDFKSSTGKDCTWERLSETKPRSDPSFR